MVPGEVEGDGRPQVRWCAGLTLCANDAVWLSDAAYLDNGGGRTSASRWLISAFSSFPGLK